MLLAGVPTWVGVETRNSLTLLSDVRGCYSFNFSFISLTVWLLDAVDVLLPLETLDEVLEGPRRPGNDRGGCRRVRRSVMPRLNRIDDVWTSELAVEAADALPEGDEVLEAVEGASDGRVGEGHVE